MMSRVACLNVDGQFLISVNPISPSFSTRVSFHLLAESCIPYNGVFSHPYLHWGTSMERSKYFIGLRSALVYLLACRYAVSKSVLDHLVLPGSCDAIIILNTVSPGTPA